LRISGKEENKMIGHKTGLILGSLAVVFAIPSILGFICNRVCGDYREIGGLIREGSPLIPSTLTRMPFSSLFEIMLLCAIVAIGGVAFGLFILRKPESEMKVESKTEYPVNRK
jgi:hypothetical protein